MATSGLQVRHIETTVGLSKVVFRLLLRTKCAFSQNPHFPICPLLGGESIYHNWPKTLMVFFVRLSSPSCTMWRADLLWISLVLTCKK